jgi:hypothetical protein
MFEGWGGVYLARFVKCGPGQTLRPWFASKK